MPPRRRSLVVSGAVIFLAWFVVAFSGELAVLLSLVGVAAQLDRGWRRLLAVLVTPLALPLLAAGNAAVGYASGDARLLVVGLPGPTIRNLDPTLRVRSRSTGCMRNGVTTLWNAPNNVTLRTLGALFGPMPRAYDGPYPTHDEATNIAHGATTRPTWEQLRVGVTVDGRRVQLANEDTYRFCGTHRARDARARVAVVHDRLVVVADEHARDDPRGPCVLLVDAPTSQLVAFYPGRAPDG